MKEVKNAKPKLKLIENDPWLEPYAPAIEGRHQNVLSKELELTNGGKISLSEFASGYLYFGLHRSRKGWVLREWAPNATEIYLVGDFNNWQSLPAYRMKRVKRSNGVWELELKSDAIKHGDLYKLRIKEKLGLNPDYYNIVDGSGVSLYNYISPRLQCYNNPD